MVVIFDLGIGERRLFGDRPQHRLDAAIEAAIHDIAADFAGDGRLGPVGHGGVIVVPVADYAEPLELLALGVDPERGELPANPAELQDRHRVLVLAARAVVLLDLPFDGQAMAVPAGDVVGIHAGHLPAAVDDILQDLVERMADMQVAVRVGRAVMQDEISPARAPPRAGGRTGPAPPSAPAPAARAQQGRRASGNPSSAGRRYRDNPGSFGGSPFAGSVKEGRRRIAASPESLSPTGACARSAHGAPAPEWRASRSAGLPAGRGL